MIIKEKKTGPDTFSVHIMLLSVSPLHKSKGASGHFWFHCNLQRNAQFLGLTSLRFKPDHDFKALYVPSCIHVYWFLLRLYKDEPQANREKHQRVWREI